MAIKRTLITLTMFWINIKLLIITTSPVTIYCAQNSVTLPKSLDNKTISAQPLAHRDIFINIINILITSVNVCEKENVRTISLDTLEQDRFKSLCYLKAVCKASNLMINNFLSGLMVRCDDSTFPFDQISPQLTLTLPSIKVVAKDFYTISLYFDVKPSPCNAAPLDQLSKEQIPTYRVKEQDYFGMYIMYKISFYNSDGTKELFENNRTYLGPGSNRLAYLTLIKKLMESTDQKIIFGIFKEFIEKKGLDFRIDNAPLLYLLILYKQAKDTIHYDRPYHQYNFPIEPFITNKKNIEIIIDDPAALFSEIYFNTIFKIHYDKKKIEAMKRYNNIVPLDCSNKIENDTQVIDANNDNLIKKNCMPLDKNKKNFYYNTLFCAFESVFITGITGFSIIFFLTLIFKLYTFFLAQHYFLI